MKIVLACPRGFCAGVEMAIQCVEQALRALGPPIYVYHQIVHNRHVVQHFEQEGAIFVDAVDQVPPGAPVVFSAHGVSPQVRLQAMERGLIQIDATCPMVNKVHAEAIRYAQQGRAIILIGHREHDEVVGTIGEAPQAIHVVGSVQEVEALQIPPGQPVVYLMQTTLSLDDAAEIVAAVRGKFPHATPPPSQDVCYATTNRQLAVATLAPQCDLTLVVGSQNSSNSIRLVEVAQNRKAKAHLIDSVADIRPEWFAGVQSVLISAGASAPEDLVQQVVQHLIDQYDGTVEQREVVTEQSIRFELPLSLRKLQTSRPDAILSEEDLATSLPADADKTVIPPEVHGFNGACDSNDSERSAQDYGQGAL